MKLLLPALPRFLLLAAALTLSARAAITKPPGDWGMVAEITAMIELPRIPARDFPITDFGAKAGGDALPAIKAAIEAATKAGGGRVIVPAGQWLCNGPVHLKSRINFHVAEGATLLFGPEAKSYLPVVLTRWEGTEVYTYSPLIYAFEVEDVAISGLGTIDGNAATEFLTWAGGGRGAGAGGAPGGRGAAGGRGGAGGGGANDTDRLRRMGADGVPVAQRVFGEGTRLRPPLIQFFRAKRILLEDYTLKNSPFWVNHIVYTESATVRRIKVDSHHGNNDGVDVDSSRFVLIENCHFRTGDDSVVVKSGRDKDGRDIARPSEYVVVRNNDMGGEDGIALGSEMSGNVRHVFFSDNILRKGVSAIRFKANLDRGGIVEHIRVRNFTVESFENLFWFQLDYPGQLGGNFPSTYRDIVFENFTVEHAGTVFNGDAPADAPLKGVILRNFTIKQADKTFVLKNVEGLVLENVTIGDQRVDGRLDWRAKAK